VRRRRTTSRLITASSIGLKVEVYKYDAPGSQNHPSNSSYQDLYRHHPAEHLTVTDSMDLSLRHSKLLSLANNVASMWSRERGLSMPYHVLEYDHRCPEVIKAIEETVIPPLTDLRGPPFESTMRWLITLGQTANAHGVANRLRENYASTPSILGHGRAIPDTIRSGKTDTQEYRSRNNSS